MREAPESTCCSLGRQLLVIVTALTGQLPPVDWARPTTGSYVLGAGGLILHEKIGRRLA